MEVPSVLTTPKVTKPDLSEHFPSSNRSTVHIMIYYPSVGDTGAAFFNLSHLAISHQSDLSQKCSSVTHTSPVH